ncbi:MAG: endonuclease [Turneriella sp.]
MRNPPLIVAALVILAATLSAAGNQRIRSFNKAKRLVMQIAGDDGRTLYCNCRFSDKEVDHDSCGYVPRRDTRRARRIEIEHVVPAENFGRSFIEWREGHATCVNKEGKPFKGRRCAGKTNETYRLMEADLYNLFPEIGELNGDRSNYRFGHVQSTDMEYGECQFKIDERVVEPRSEIRGDIARIYFYMDATYPERGILGNKSRKLFEAWDKADPVDAAECERASKIEKLQGNANDFVKRPCLEAGLYIAD